MGGAVRRLWLATLLSAASGCLIVLGASRFDIAPLGWIALVPLMFAVERARYRRVFWCSWICGLAANALGFYWITELLIRFGRLPLWLAVVLHLLLSAFQALAFPAAALAAVWLRRRSVPMVVAWVGGFLASDYLFPMVFPWFLAMTQHGNVPFIQIADLAGVAGVSALLVAVNVGLCVGACRLVPALRSSAPEPPGRALWSLRVVAAAALAAQVYGWVQIAGYRARREGADAVPIGVVQPNIGIEEKWDRGRRFDHIGRLQRMTAEVERAGATIAVWPETAWPIALSHDPPPDGGPRRDFDPETPERIRRGFRIPLLFGVITRSAEPPRSYNSAFLLDAAGNLHGPVSKNVLLIFGEYIPFRDALTFLDRWFPRAGSLEAGREPGVLEVGNLSLGVLNCYEDILPRYVGRMMREREPHVLVNVTNDAWFGDTAEPHQHFALSVFRAVEQRRELVRSVNTGVSGHVTAAGEVLAYTPTFREAAFVADVVPYAGRTVYGFVGDAPGYAALGALAAWALLRARRRRG